MQRRRIGKKGRRRRRMGGGSGRKRKRFERELDVYWNWKQNVLPTSLSHPLL